MRRILQVSAVAVSSYASMVAVSSTSDMAPINSVIGVDLPALPYPYNSLEPHIDEKTMRIHHDKHHAKYVSNTKDLIAGTALQSEPSIINILRHASTNNMPGLFNNAAQSYNHAFYWECMKPNGGGKPKDPKLISLIDKSFGSYDQFRAKFIDAGTTVFGSGWVWLVLNPNGSLEIVKSSNADTPIAKDNGVVPLLVMDVWEHAYYLHYQNVRPNYINAFVDHLINWEFVADQIPK